MFLAVLFGLPAGIPVLIWWIGALDREYRERSLRMRHHYALKTMSEGDYDEDYGRIS